MQGQFESDRHGARLDEKLPTTFSACHVEVFNEMNKKHGCALPSTDKVLHDRKDSKEENCGPKSDVCVNPDPSKKQPEIDWKKVEPMPAPKPMPREGDPTPAPKPMPPKGEPMPAPRPMPPKGEPIPAPRPMPPKGEPIPMPEPKFPRIDEPMPKAPPKIDDTLPKYPKRGESGPKLPAEKDLDSHGRSTDKQPGGRSPGGDAKHNTRPRTDCGFGGSDHHENPGDLNTYRPAGGPQRQAPSDAKSGIGHKANVMNQFPTVELFAR